MFNFQERNRIVNGKECRINQWPWAVILGRLRSGSSSFRVMCGGTLVTKRHVLSAAHCFTGKQVHDMYGSHSKSMKLSKCHIPSKVEIGNLTNFNVLMSSSFFWIY